MFGFFYGYPLFYFFNDLFFLRLANSAIIIINISLFAYVFWILGASFRLLIVWSILVVGLFQINGVGLDPVGGFAFHYPILGSQLAVVFILFLKWIIKNQPVYLYSSLFFWLLIMTCYEINFIFIPIGLVIIFFNSKSNRIFPAILLTFTSLIYLSINFYFRTHSSGGGYQGSAFGLVPNIFLAYVKQLTSSFPLISYLAITHQSIPFVSLIKELLFSYLAWFLFVFSTIIFTNYSYHNYNTSNLRKETFFISLGMFLLPAFFPAISLRYQTEVGWGAGTLPVYYQNFGLAFLIACVLTLMPKVRIIRFIIPIIIGIYLAINLTINTGMVKILDKMWREPRDIFAFQVQSGLFSQVKDGDIIHVKNVSHYINSNLIFQWSGKRVYVPTDDHFWFPEFPGEFAKSFELHRNVTDGSYKLFPDFYNSTLSEGIQ